MSVFYSFHYSKDYWRVQQIMNMGLVEGQPLLNSQDWESIKRGGDIAIQNWIDKQMKYKSALVVLVGSQTATRRWVKYEIRKAWNEKRPIVGIRINELEDSSGYTDAQGADPFAQIKTDSGYALSTWLKLYTPSGSTSREVYASIQNNLNSWVDSAYRRS